MPTLFQRLALASATVLLLASCGDSDDPEDSAGPDPSDTSSASINAPATESPGEPSDKPRKSHQPDPTEEAGESVTRARFCSDIDPAGIGSILGLDGLEVVVDTEPGDGSNYWTCTIGQNAGSSVGVTMNILDAPAEPSTVAATLDNLTGTLGPKNCTNVGDEALGAGTRGIDCNGTSSGTGFTMVARAVVVGGTQIECLLASYSPDDLTSLRAAAPAVCAVFRDLVVS